MSTEKFRLLEAHDYTMASGRGSRILLLAVIVIGFASSLYIWHLMTKNEAIVDQLLSTQSELHNCMKRNDICVKEMESVALEKEKCESKINELQSQVNMQKEQKDVEMASWEQDKQDLEKSLAQKVEQISQLTSEKASAASLVTNLQENLAKVRHSLEELQSEKADLERQKMESQERKQQETQQEGSKAREENKESQERKQQETQQEGSKAREENKEPQERQSPKVHPTSVESAGKNRPNPSGPVPPDTASDMDQHKSDNLTNMSAQERLVDKQTDTKNELTDKNQAATSDSVNALPEDQKKNRGDGDSDNIPDQEEQLKTPAGDPDPLSTETGMGKDSSIRTDSQEVPNHPDREQNETDDMDANAEDAAQKQDVDLGVDQDQDQETTPSSNKK